MSAYFGPPSTFITSNDVYGITLYNASINTGTTGNYGPFGGYQLSVNMDQTACNSSGVFLELKDNIPWTNIIFEMYLTMYASCWSFGVDGYGVAGANLLAYDEALGDCIVRSYNCWELPQFQSHNRTSACDNDPNNFFHSSYQVGDPKIFFMKRRRNVNGSRGGITHGRACMTPGLTIIRNIRIW